MAKLNGFLGIIVIMGVAYALSTNRKAIQKRVVLWGLGLQWFFAFLVLKTPFYTVLEKVRDGGMKLLGYSEAGSTFVFGSLGGPANDSSLGLIFAFRVLPIIIFIASFFSVMYYLGIMQIVVKAFAKVMTYIMGASGAESLNVAASIFMGQTEAPLTIKPFLHDMTESELMTVMTCGMAHVSGAVMGAYVLMGHVDMLHLLTAVIMTAPATILMAKMFIPETGTPRTAGDVHMEPDPDKPVNVIEAAGRGAIDGLHLALNIAAILIAFIALIALINGILGLASFQGQPLGLERIFGWVFAPIAWLLGVGWKDAPSIGGLLGTRLVLNEFVAFRELGKIQGKLDPHSFVIATYALCGFANFSSIGIQIGGIGSLAPNRRSDLARLGLKAVLAGTLANFMSAAIAGMLL
jgi:CNT family concentrative nucleoside transporter